MNNVVLIGRLTRDVELRTTASGISNASFSLAVDRNFRNQQGEREADFINCVAWRGTAETLARYTHKGARIAVQGRIQTRNYDNQQGQRVYVTEVVVENFDFLETRAESENYRQQHGYGNQGYTPNYGQPNYGNSNPYGTPDGGNMNNYGGFDGQNQAGSQPMSNMGNGQPAGNFGQAGFGGNAAGENIPAANAKPVDDQAQASENNEPFSDNGEQVDLADDDLPF